MSHFEFLSVVIIWVCEFCYNFSLFGLVTVRVFEFCKYSSVFEFGHNLRFEFCHILSYWVLLQFKWLSFVNIFIFLRFFTIGVFEFCNYLIFCFVLSQLIVNILAQFELLSFFPFHFMIFVTVWVLEFGQNMCVWVLDDLSFVTIWVLSFIWVFESCECLSFRVLS